MITRRGIITGLISLAAAPTIVRASSLMRCSPTGQLDKWIGMADWPVATPEEILDEVRRAISIASGIPERMLRGDWRQGDQMTDEETRYYQRVVWNYP
jgi:hypothetical protein